MFNKNNFRLRGYIFLLSIFLTMLSFPVRAELVDEVVAIVNNEVITLSELRKVSQVNFANTDPSAYREVLEKLIDQKLVDQATQDLQIKVSEQEVDAVIKTLKDNNKITDEQLKDALRQQGLTWEQYRKEIREGIRRNQAIAQMIRSQVNVTDTEINDFYEKHPENFFEPAQVKVEQLFFPFPDPTTPEKTKLITQRADESLRKVKSGEDFQIVAQKCNLPSTTASCDVGMYKKGELNDALDQEAFALKPGEISNVITTDKGCCIIRVLERSEEKNKKIDEVRGAISNYLFQEKMGSKLQEWILQLRSNAYIDIKI